MKKWSFSKVFLLGFGFFGISLLWSLYNTDIPMILQTQYGFTNFQTGLVMNLDNILAIFLIPLVGAWSDRVWTKIGRRMPFIVTGMPAGAILFALVPLVPAILGASSASLFLMISVIFFMNIAMAVSRAPVIALMPDIVPSEERSPANGIINLMGGLGSLLVYFFIGRLSAQNRPLGFSVSAAGLLISSLIVFTFIKESRDSITPSRESGNKGSILSSLWSLAKKENRSLLYLLLAIFFWFVGFGAVENFYAPYMALESGLEQAAGESFAKFNLGLLSLTFMFLSLPSGFLAKKLGRKRTILTGIVGLLAVFAGLYIIKSLMIQRLLFVIGGLSWALININSLPMVLDMGDTQSQGTYTGLYYFFSQIAAIIAPPFTGFLADMAGTRAVMFLVGIVFSILAFVSLARVQGGEGVRK